MKVSIIGCGKMGESILKGLLNKGFKESDIFITTKTTTHLDKLLDKYKVTGSTKNIDAIKFSDIVILSIKPQNLEEISKELTGKFDGKILISILAGISIKNLKDYLKAKKVVGVDISRSLINIAKKNLPDVEFKVMDMEKLELAQSSFDLVYSSLVLHYVKDWTKVLGEVRKVLKKNGIFLFSTHSPIYWSAFKKEDGNEKLRILGYKKDKKTKKIKVYGDYFNVRKINDTWLDNFKVTYYHKPFSFIIKDILKSEFKIIDCIEPRPLDSVKRIDLEFWKKTSKLPLFIIFKLQK